MRKKLFITAAVLICLAATFSVSAAFAAIDRPDTAVESSTNNGFTYNKYEYTHNGNKQVLFMGEYKADASGDYEFVVHNVTDSARNTVLNKVIDIAADYEKTTGRKVLMATNGDYFYTTGNNVESYVKDGIVITKGAFTYKHCLGFDNKGNFALGRMTDCAVNLMVVVNGERRLIAVDKINREPADGEVAIYTSGTVSVTGAGIYKITAEASNLLQYPVYGQSRRTETGELTGGGSITLNSKEFAVVVKGDNEINRFLYDNLYYGVECNLVEIPKGSFENMTYVVGGYDMLVNEGIVNTSCHTDNDGNGNAPRTFIGVKEDGTTFLGVVDGRQSGYSVGITVNQEAELAAAFGAKYALELDGGGSSTFVLREDDVLTVKNIPSDRSNGQSVERKVSNAILLVEKEKTDEKDPASTDKGCKSTVSASGLMLAVAAIAAAIKIRKHA